MLNEALVPALLPMPMPCLHCHAHIPIADTHARMPTGVHCPVPSASEFTLPTFIPQLPDQDFFQDRTAHLLLIAAGPFNTVLQQQL